jgi:acyl-CoA hydrolase
MKNKIINVLILVRILIDKYSSYIISVNKKFKGENFMEKTVKESRIIMANAMQPYDANPAGNVHGGVIMKHIDDAGGMVAIRHAGTLCVTASIDRLDFHYPVFVGDLLILKASINMVGKTSIEVGVRVETENPMTGKVRHTASAYLTYVALGKDFKPIKVNSLKLETKTDIRRNKEAKDRKIVRLAEKTREKVCIDN